MNVEQEELQFLGLFGIFKDSIKILTSWIKTFSLIALTLILPLCSIFLLHIEVSNIHFRKIMINTQEIVDTPQDTLQCFTFYLIFSLLSTSPLVYTVASSYTTRKLNITSVMSVGQKVCKRLIVTFLCTFVAFYVYNIMAILVFIIWEFFIGYNNGGVVSLVIIGILYFIGTLYITLVMHLASVVTILEDFYGVEAMMKSNELVKGKMGLSIVVFLMLSVSIFGIQFLFKEVVVGGWGLSFVGRTMYGILCVVLLPHFFLFGYVIQMELNHDGEYEPLKDKEVQLDNCQV